MAYLYHRVPVNMRGDVLYPLNVLKITMPDVYEEAIVKYKDREHVLAEVIAPLDCLWNDAIHLTAVHPAEIVEALAKAGKRVSQNFYEIDPGMLDPKLATVYLYTEEKGAKKEYTTFDPESLEQYAHLPITTQDYYKGVVARGRDPLLFHMVPHILYKGTLDISNVRIISV